MRRLVLGLMLALALPGTAALAVEPDEMLDDPTLERRARDISQELRCLVCQNQSIDDSDAPLARDLRLLVRDRLQAGDSDEEVVDYIVSRYGDFVLLEPRFKATTAVLWIGPAVILIAGAAGAVVWHRRRRQAGGVAPLTDEETRRLDEIMGDRTGDGERP